MVFYKSHINIRTSYFTPRFKISRAGNAHLCPSFFLKLGKFEQVKQVFTYFRPRQASY